MASDTTAPTLTSISLSASSLDPHSGQTSLLVTAQFADDLSGIFDGTFADGLGGSPPQILFVSPSGQFVYGLFDILHPLSGNSLNGEYQATITLGANAEAGIWQVQSLLLNDEAGNSHSYTGAELAALGLTTSFTVTSSNAITDDYAASTSTTGVVAIGGSTTGNIETTGDADWFTVTLTAGTTYQFDLKGSDTGDGTLVNPHLSLLNSTGTQLLSDYDSGGYAGPGEGYSSLLTYTATATGTFYLASNALGNGTGAYKLSATSVGAITDDYAASTSTTGVVAIGGSTTGNIETTGDADWFTVTLTAGTTYQFDLKGSDTGDGTLVNPHLSLLNSTGTQLLSDYDSGGYAGPGEGYSSLLTYTATATGTFYLASNALGNGTGAYKLSATSVGAITDDYAASTSTTGVVAIGGSTTGNIETTGDADWFTVTLTAGTTYQFDLKGSDTGDGTLVNPHLSLLNSTGTQLLSDYDSGGYAGPGEGYSSLLTYTATATGTFYLASNALGNGTGAYKLSATQLFINAAPTLALNNEVATLSENADTTNRVKVADITITDDGEGTNAVTLSGDDAALFEIDGAELFLKANTVLNYEGDNTTLDVTVEVDDPAVGSTPDASEALSIAITDVNEAITNGNGGGTLAGTPGNDLIDGQGGNDRINAGAGNDTITGGPGLDIVNAGNGDDTIVAAIGDGSLDVYRGGAGIDTLDMSDITAPAAVNLAFSFVSSSQTGWDALTFIENVIGGSGNDAITGNGVVNRLEGQGGNDTINAGGGNDVVIGGAGNDTMNGGPGNDLFIFGPGFGNDRILGFDANPTGGQDLLDISAFGITSADFAARVTIADVGADTLVTIDGNAAETIRLVGIGNTTAVTQADFVLLLS